MKWEQLCKLGRELPEVTEELWYGTPALKVRGKGFVRLKDDGQSVVFRLFSLEEQEFLIATQPDLYFITDHYVGWPMVLARLPALRIPEARLRLETAWRVKAPPKLVALRTGPEAVSGSPRPRAKSKPKRKARARAGR